MCPIISLSIFARMVHRRAELISYLEQFLTERRKKRLQEVLDERTAHLRIVLEDVYQAHNASAVLRSCDCFGVQHVHFIENRNTIRVSDDVAMGSSSWLTLHRHREKERNTRQALENLRAAGYRIVVTTPHKESYTPAHLPLTQKTALIFGTEMQGASREAMEMADDYLRIPMFGFTESFNISVSAALCMYELSRRIRKEVADWHLPDEEKEDVYLQWVRASLEHGELLERNFLNGKK